MSSAPAFDPMDIDSGNAEPQAPRVPYDAPSTQTKIVSTKQRKPIRFGM